jgi:hypothetical protein
MRGGPTSDDTDAARSCESHHGDMTDRPSRRLLTAPRRAVARWIMPVYALLALAIVPWIIWLAWSLPERSVSAHYRLAWVGFDVLLCGALARTAYLAWRRSPFLVNVASATAALLVVDAWFDVTTSPGGHDLLVSTVLALLVELPLAVMSLLLAGRAQVEIARTGAVNRRRWLPRFDTTRRLDSSPPSGVSQGEVTEVADSRP